MEKRDYMYDCYDENENSLGIFFEKDCKELLRNHPEVKYVRGMDAVTRLPKWHEVKETGLFPYTPQKETHKKECDWSYTDFIS